jgi:hypothetical protein
MGHRFGPITQEQAKQVAIKALGVEPDDSLEIEVIRNRTPSSPAKTSSHWVVVFRWVGWDGDRVVEVDDFDGSIRIL